LSKYEILVTPGSSKGRKRSFDYEECKKITDYCGAEVLTDMAQFAGFVVAGVHPSPIPHANVVTATTFENLYGFGGELILSKETDLEKSSTMLFFICSGVLSLNATASKDVLVRPRNPIASYTHPRS